MSATGNSTSDRDVFQQFYFKLVETLPMDDIKFIAKLYSESLLPGNLKSQLKSEKTSADKAALFLDSVIEPSVTSDGGSSFDKLLHVMEDSEYQHVKELAEQIRTSLRNGSSSNNAGTFQSILFRSHNCLFIGHVRCSVVCSSSCHIILYCVDSQLLAM